jgi:hypothetical protein
MARDESQPPQAYMPNGLRLVNGTTVVPDLVRDLQRPMTLFVIGPYEGAYLSLYRGIYHGENEPCTLLYWRTMKQLSYVQLSAMPHQTLDYPQNHQQQCEVIKTLILDTFFAVPAEVTVLRCPRCGSTDPTQWMWVQYTRVNYAGVRVTATAVEVKTEGDIAYESVINEHLRCKCGGEIDQGDLDIVYV